MRYLILFFLLVVAVILFLNDDSESDDLEEQNNQLHEEIADLKFKVIDAGKDVMVAEIRVKDLENQLDEMMHVGTVSARDLTWEELKEFVKHDKTDSCQYKLNEFDCEGYAIRLRDHANAHGYDCAYVSIGFEKGTIGHTLNAFQTVDYGLIYIDNTEQDAVGYLKKDRIYGTIAIDSVRKRYIDTGMAPDQFHAPITYVEFPGNTFDYTYYEDYLNRYQFYMHSREACNQEIDAYNLTIEQYNQNNASLDRNELNTWEDKLDRWAANLDALLEELGPVRTENNDIVGTIEVYWNEELNKETITDWQ